MRSQYRERLHATDDGSAARAIPVRAQEATREMVGGTCRDLQWRKSRRRPIFSMKFLIS